ncbi:hypothetical protein DUNSADRAFT_6188 [Dunaliella salina]|uniref:Encoded protein n=1 Tax=Dunaliella salina TaxID=3046 RepID=A0ABQ7GNU1_DUNSA|nr:hypothetical protein DUNSADRAFT_6188 [Dunaliella salina]|eukprot:KAF5836280.1 hypothetical protein DUNSADRAFT_6188 [Dunaliella salina]
MYVYVARSGATCISACTAKAPKRGIDENVGILVSGCLARECAADARPPESEPHGAFSHAVNKLLRQLHAEEALPVSNRELILGVRDSLSRTGFAQSPCLECAEKWADAPFILREEE